MSIEEAKKDRGMGERTETEGWRGKTFVGLSECVAIVSILVRTESKVVPVQRPC